MFTCAYRAGSWCEACRNGLSDAAPPPLDPSRLPHWNASAAARAGLPASARRGAFSEGPSGRVLVEGVVLPGEGSIGGFGFIGVESIGAVEFMGGMVLFKGGMSSPGCGCGSGSG